MIPQDRGPGRCWSDGRQCHRSGCHGEGWECKWAYIEDEDGYESHHCACHYNDVRQEPWSGWLTYIFLDDLKDKKKKPSSKETWGAIQ